MKKSLGPRALIQPNPVLIVGSYDQNNRPNIMAVAWGGHLLQQAALRRHIAQASDLHLRQHSA